jgi:hypothetical protein
MMMDARRPLIIFNITMPMGSKLKTLLIMDASNCTIVWSKTNN